MNQEVLSLLADADKVLIGIGETFERKDELDGEKSPGTPMTCEYADNLHFASTKFI